MHISCLRLVIELEILLTAVLLEHTEFSMRVVSFWLWICSIVLYDSTPIEKIRFHLSYTLNQPSAHIGSTWNCCSSLWTPEMLSQIDEFCWIRNGDSVRVKWNLCPRYYWLRLTSRIRYFSYYWHQTIRSAPNHILFVISTFHFLITLHPIHAWPT